VRASIASATSERQLFLELQLGSLLLAAASGLFRGKSMLKRWCNTKATQKSLWSNL